MSPGKDSEDSKDMESRDLILQRLHDGELPAAQAEALRRELDAKDQEKLLALEELSGLVHGAVTHQAGQAGELDLWTGIEKRLPAPGKLLPLRRRARATTAMATMLAMAAAFLVWFSARPRQTNYCDVESLEAIGGSATVLKVPGDHGDTTTVIWVDHQESDEWDTL